MGRNDLCFPFFQEKSQNARIATESSFIHIDAFMNALRHMCSFCV